MDLFNIYNQSVYVETAFNRYFLGNLVGAGQHEETYLRLFLSANNPYFASFRCNRLERTNNKKNIPFDFCRKPWQKTFSLLLFEGKEIQWKGSPTISGNSRDVRFCEFKGFSISYYFFSPRDYCKAFSSVQRISGIFRETPPEWLGFCRRSIKTRPACAAGYRLGGRTH